MEREDASFRIEFMQGGGDLSEFAEVRQLVGIAGNLDERDRRSRLFELGRKREAGLSWSEREGDERRRHIEFVEGAGHRVLAADGSQAEAVLRLIGS